MLKKNTILNTSFDQYVIVDKIGEGGNGAVFKVKNDDGGLFAAKVVCKNDLSKEKIKRFKNEIGFCQKYDNNHIIKVFDNGYFQADGKEYIFYIMPLYTCSLRSKMKDALSIEKSINYFLCVCEGLKFAHSHSCVHRDIKPENILIGTNNDDCVIADFGIAHFIDCDQITTVETKETSRLANFTYHAPEQSNASGSATPMTDIFALGLIFNEMITGVVPAGDNYKKISNVDANYAFLDSIVSKMICQNPQNRYQSIDQLLLDYTARKRQAANEKTISSLREPLLRGEIHDDITDNPPKPVEIKYENGLTVKLSNYVNAKWIEFYNNALSSYTTIPYCYKSFRFNFDMAIYRGNISSLSKVNIQKLISEFQTAVTKANRDYASWLVVITQRQQQQEIENRQAEIARLEKENDLNDFLKGLI